MCLFFHLISNNLVMSILMLSHVLSHVTTLKESERLFKKKKSKFQIEGWTFIGSAAVGSFWVFLFCLFLFCFCFDSDIKCISDCLTIKRKRDHTNFCCMFFFGKSDKLFFLTRNYVYITLTMHT